MPGVGPLEDLAAQLHRISNGDGAAADKTAALTDLRERINDVLGEADRLIAMQHRVREAEAVGSRRTRLVARENAGLREEALAGGLLEEAELDEAALLSHGELDRLREEGLEPEAMEQLGREFRPEHLP